MKFLHTGDLHIGKIVNEFSLLEDQKYVLNQIEEIAIARQVDAVVIAGDVYDRSIPSTEGVKLLDSFLTRLLQKEIKILMISGNHDSPERVEFAEQILESRGLYIAGTIGESLKEITLGEGENKITFVLLPFVKPAVVGARTSQEAVEKLLEKVNRSTDVHHKKVLITHFFVTGKSGEAPQLSESESTLHVGGVEQVRADTFQGFDYVALGHIHKAQKIGENHCYYAGSPLKYSFSEAEQTKSVNVVTIGQEIEVEQVPLKPLHEMRKIKGNLKDLITEEVVCQADATDYIQATLTNEEELIDPIGTLRSVYPNVMQLVMERKGKKRLQEIQEQQAKRTRSMGELFEDFYQMVWEQELNEEKRSVIQEAVEECGQSI